MSLRRITKLSVVTGLILGLTGLLTAGPVAAIAQGVGGWALLRRWETLRQRWPLTAGLTSLTTAVILVLLAIALDLTFLILFGRMVQRAMP